MEQFAGENRVSHRLCTTQQTRQIPIIRKLADENREVIDMLHSARDVALRFDLPLKATFSTIQHSQELKDKEDTRKPFLPSFLPSCLATPRSTVIAPPKASATAESNNAFDEVVRAVS